MKQTFKLTGDADRGLRDLRKDIGTLYKWVKRKKYKKKY